MFIYISVNYYDFRSLYSYIFYRFTYLYSIYPWYYQYGINASRRNHTHSVFMDRLFFFFNIKNNWKNITSREAVVKIRLSSRCFFSLLHHYLFWTTLTLLVFVSFVISVYQFYGSGWFARQVFSTRNGSQNHSEHFEAHFRAWKIVCKITTTHCFFFSRASFLFIFEPGFVWPGASRHVEANGLPDSAGGDAVARVVLRGQQSSLATLRF